MMNGFRRLGYGYYSKTAPPTRDFCKQHLGRYELCGPEAPKANNDQPEALPSVFGQTLCGKERWKLDTLLGSS